MKRRPFWLVLLVAIMGVSFIGVSLSGCGSDMQAQKLAGPPTPQWKVVPPEPKVEIPEAPAPEVKKEVPPPPPPAPLAPAPQKKKKG